MNNNINDNTNDPFEEFEFKPLTEGLGFHRNKETAKPTPNNLTTTQRNNDIMK